MRLTPCCAELRRIEAFTGRLPRSPLQIHAVHEADAELVELPGAPGFLLAAKTDALVEEIESGLYADPELIGWMGVAASLSDLAAVAADPLGVVVALTVPPDAADADVARIGDGAAAACAAAGTFVLGGDTNEGERLAICGSAVGLVPRAGVLTRRGARAGDAVYLSGPAGLGNAYALARLHNGTAPRFRPAPRVAEGRLLRGAARCCIDTSDGVLHALDVLMRVNGCRAVVDAPAEGILHPTALAVAAARGLPPWLAMAGVHGEFELCFTVGCDREQDLVAALRRTGAAPVRLGHVSEGEGITLGVAGGCLELDVEALRVADGIAARDPDAYVARLVALTRAAAGRKGAP